MSSVKRKAISNHEPDSSSIPQQKVEQSAYQLFDRQLVESGVDETLDVEYQPVNSLSNGGQIIYDMPASPDMYTDLNESNFIVSVHVTKINEAGASVDITAADAVAPVNAFMNGLVSNASLYAGGKLVNGHSSGMQHQISFLNYQLNYSAAAKKTHLRESIVFLDDFPAATGALKDNVNLTTRGESLILKNGRLTMCGKFWLELFHSQSKLIPNGVGLALFLERNKVGFCLLCDVEGAKFQINITECTLLLRRVRLVQSMMHSIDARLAREAAKLFFTKLETRQFLVPAGTTNFRNLSLFNGLLPKKALLFFVHPEQLSDDLTSNPLWFNHHNANYVQFFRNGRPVTSRPIECDWAGKSYMPAYRSVLSMLGATNTNKEVDLDYEAFGNNLSLWGVRLEADNFAASKQGSFGLEVRFKNRANSDKTLIGVLVCEFASCLWIDKNRECSVIDV